MWTEAQGTKVAAIVTSDNPEGLGREVSPNFRNGIYPGVGNVTHVLLLTAKPNTQSSLMDTSSIAPRQSIH